MIALENLPLGHRNSHDVEDPALCDFLRLFASRFSEESAMLDMGCHDSKRHYARQARAIFPGIYEGIDLLPDPDTALLLNEYHVGNFLTTHLAHFDLVFSVSALEHCGISTYQANSYRDERCDVAAKMFHLAKQFVFLTFPFGAEGLIKGQYANITEDDLRAIDRRAEFYGFQGLAFDFYHNEFPQQGKPWKAISQQLAGQVPLDPSIEVQCVGVASWMRK